MFSFNQSDLRFFGIFSFVSVPFAKVPWHTVPSLRKYVLNELFIKFPSVRFSKRLTSLPRLYRSLELWNLGTNARPFFPQVPLFEGTEIGFLKMLSMKIKPVYFLSKEYVVRKGDIGQEVRTNYAITERFLASLLVKSYRRWEYGPWYDVTQSNVNFGKHVKLSALFFFFKKQHPKCCKTSTKQLGPNFLHIWQLQEEKLRSHELPHARVSWLWFSI